jgi:hypothetical protein
MDLFLPTEHLRAVGNIRDGARRWTAEQLNSTLELARKRKPVDLDSVSMGTQRRYRGNQRKIVETALGREFPETRNMPIAAINWMRLLARLDAGVYVVPSDRWLEDAAGKRLPDEDEASKLWAWALKKARLHVQMAELERRALLPPGCHFAQVVWVKPPGDPIGYPRIDLYWPHDVLVLCHKDAPTTWAYRYVVALRQASPDPSKQGDWWRVWSREPADDLDGEWGPWQSVLVSTEGDQMGKSAEPVPYDGTILPVFLVQLTDAEGSVFSNEDTDLLDVVDDLNKRRSNESFVIGLQGHDQMWQSGTSETGAKKGGPDAILQVPPGERMEVLSFNPALAEMRESRKQAMRELAISRANSPDAYATEPGPPLSAASKRISNIAHDTKIAEQAVLMQSIEEDDEGPLAILADVVRTYHPEGERLLEGKTPHMMPRKPPVVEDQAQRQQRLGDAVDRKWITDARAAFEAEFYATPELAQKAIDEIEAAAEPEPEPPPPPMPGDQPPELADDTNDPPAQPEVP